MSSDTTQPVGNALFMKATAARALPLDDPSYRPNTIAERTGRHAESIRRAIRLGEMTAVRLGKRAIGVRASEVARWLDALQKEAPEPVKQDGKEAAYHAPDPSRQRAN
jgi:hypothetical protein